MHSTGGRKLDSHFLNLANDPAASVDHFSDLFPILDPSSFFLRLTSHNTNHLKVCHSVAFSTFHDVVQAFLSFSKTCSSPEGNPQAHEQLLPVPLSLQALATMNLLLVSRDLSFLHILYKWNHRIHGLL